MRKTINQSLILAVILFISGSIIKAQSLQLPEHRETIHSPQVTLINQFGDYPVDLSNGLVDISIPLYEIKTPGLSMPLSLKFHPSGLRYDERESILGIRWALSGLGQVSRVVKGYPDDYHYHYPLHENINNPYYIPDFFTLYGTTSTMYKSSGQTYNSVFNTMGGQYKDTEYDIFSYTLPSGKSGKFILTDSNETAVLMPYEPIKIVMGKGATMYRSVFITDEDGIMYNFQMSEYDDNGYATAFHLKQITSANKQDVITINYTYSDLYSVPNSKNIVASHDLHDYTRYEQYYREDVNATTYSPLQEALVSLFSNQDYFFYINNYGGLIIGDRYAVESIQVESGGKQTCVVEYYYTATQSNSVKYLEEIMVTNADGDLVQNIYFTLKNNQSNKFKLLDKVEIMQWTDSKEVYTFDYYDSQHAPACRDLSKNFDWWGYYSSGAGEYYAQDITLKIPLKENGNPNLITVKMEGGHKTPDANSMKIGMIKEIAYPTGGRTKFEYEANEFGTKKIGGLRIKKIDNISGSGKTESKYYEYAGPAIPSYLQTPFNTRIMMENEIECYHRTTTSHNSLLGIGQGRYLQTTYFRSFPSEYTQFQSNIISYGKVTEYFGSSPTDNTGKIEYKYSINELGTSLYKDKYGSDFQSTHSRYTHLHVSPADFWKKNHLYSKSIYKSIGKGYNIQYKEIEKYDYDYKSFREGSFYDKPVYRYRRHQIGITVQGYNKNQIEMDLIYPLKDLLNDVFAYAKQRYTTGAEKLVKETRYTYHDNGTETTIKEYDYDPNYILPIEEKVTNSDGTVYSTKYKYSFHINGSPYTSMKNANILSTITQKSIAKDGVTLEQLGYNYEDITKLTMIGYRKVGAEDMKDVIWYSNHDFNSLPREVVKNSSEYIVYIRDLYGNIVAEILNTRYANVASALGGQAVIDRISKSSQVSYSDMILLNNLRTTLPEAHVYTYTYRPLIGMLSITDPKGCSTYYEYDDSNRLEYIRDNQYNWVEEYRYNFSNK